MIISSFRKRRNSVDIFFDDGSKIILDYRIVFDNGLRKYDEINEQQKDKLITENEKLKIKDSAFRLLARRHHSRFELIQKMNQKGFCKNLVLEIVENLSGSGYLNDSEFAIAYANERMSKRKIGINKIRAELFKKGVEKTIIENVLGGIPEIESESAIKILAERKLKSINNKESDKRKIIQKLWGYLYSKGFDSDLIKKTVSELLKEADYPDL